MEERYARTVRRLRRSACVALDAWERETPRLVLLRHAHNSVFRVDSGGVRFVLRLQRPGWNTVEAIRSEMQWLSALRRETDLTVPEPVATPEGAWVVTVPDGDGGTRDAVLLRWVEGRFQRRRPSRTGLFRVGALTARLHAHARSFVPPPGFVRKRWDAEGLLGGALGIDVAATLAALANGERAALEAAREKARAAIAALPAGSEHFGLIHADLHPGNCLFYRGEARPIDFDDCGFGYFVYDLAVTLDILKRYEEYPARRAALLAGYGAVAPLPEGTEAALATLGAAREIAMALYLTARRDDPGIGPRFRPEVVRRIEALRRWTAGEASVV